MLDVHSKLFSNFIILEDREDLNAADLFAAFLKYFAQKHSSEEIHVICLENTPQFYFGQNIEKSDKFITHNYFSDIRSWNNQSSDIISFLSNCEKFSQTILFFDSLSHLVIHFGFNTVYKVLFNLKSKAKKIVCLAHGDLFNLNQIHELKTLSTTYVKVKGDCTSLVTKKTSKKSKIIDVTYKQNSSKPHSYTLAISLDDDLRFSISQNCGGLLVKEPDKVKDDLKTLTTFKLGLNLSENEEKARNELVLPFLRSTTQPCKDNAVNIEDFDVEDDPDDDLDF